MEGRVYEEAKSYGKKLLSSQGSSERHMRVKHMKKKKKRPCLSMFFIFSMRKRVQKKRACRLCKRGLLHGSEFHLFPTPHLRVITPRILKFRKALHLGNAEKALKFYEKSQGAEFEIVEVFYSARSFLGHPKSQCGEECVHVSFTAKPKIADSSDVSPIYLFGELFVGYRPSYVNSCFTFKPSDDPGFNHGCIFCPADQKFHPATGYRVSSLPWYVPEMILV